MEPMIHPQTVAEIQRLILNYQKDFEEYQELFQYVDSCLEILEQYSKSDSELEDESLEFLSPFLDKRRNMYAQLQRRADINSKIRKNICTQIGIENFTLESLISTVPRSQFEQLENLMLLLQDKMQEVSSKDKLLIQKLSLELQGAKLELNRLRGGQLARQRYQSETGLKALFIDKNK